MYKFSHFPSAVFPAKVVEKFAFPIEMGGHLIARKRIPIKKIKKE